MLILFKLWQNVSDLKEPGVSWSVAFDSVNFSEHALDIIKNINVENECKDACGAHCADRLLGKPKRTLMDGFVVADPLCDMSTL